MGLSQENTGPLKVKKIPMYLLTRAELLYTLCNEIPCSICNRCIFCKSSKVRSRFNHYMLGSRQLMSSYSGKKLLLVPIIGSPLVVSNCSLTGFATWSRIPEMTSSYSLSSSYSVSSSGYSR